MGFGGGGGCGGLGGEKKGGRDAAPPGCTHAAAPPSPALARAWRSGDCVGDWILHSRLGRGGFAEVWLAYGRTGPSATSPAALKIFTHEGTHPSMCSRREYLIQRELLLAVPAGPLHTPLAHEHLVVNGKGVIVMEYYPLKWRNVFSRRAGGRGGPAAVDSLLQLVSGLAQLHLAGYLHRDIKPDNLVLSQDLQRLCLVDYGLAYRRRSPPAGASAPLPPASGAHSQWGTCIVGTWAYMSPRAHRAEPSHPVDDLWSVGYMLAEILAEDRLPWAGSRRHRGKHGRNHHVLQQKLEWGKQQEGPVGKYLDLCGRLSKKPWTQRPDYVELYGLVSLAREACREPPMGQSRRYSQSLAEKAAAPLRQLATR